MLSKWNNWIYTWIRYRDPDDVLYSNDVELHYVFNNIDLEEDELNDCGKFKHGKCSLQMWEPKRQEDMLQFAKIFAEHPHEEGYVYAINVDTLMYQVYTAEVNKENMNWNIIDDRVATMKCNVFKVVEVLLMLICR